MSLQLSLFDVTEKPKPETVRVRLYDKYEFRFYLDLPLQKTEKAMKIIIMETIKPIRKKRIKEGIRFSRIRIAKYSDTTINLT